MLFFQGGEPFAVGVMDYEFRPVIPGDINTRIILRINVESIPALAVMDTGAPYLIIAPAVADRLGFTPDHSLNRTDITIRGEKYSGNLYRVDVELTALEGLSTTFQATAFVPDPDQVDKWGNLPTFLGIESCLERIRFALDPLTSRFYFGALP
jgi:hypothetical protein